MQLSAISFMPPSGWDDRLYGCVRAAERKIYYSRTQKSCRRDANKRFAQVAPVLLMARDGDDTLGYALVDRNRRPQRHRL